MSHWRDGDLSTYMRGKYKQTVKADDCYKQPDTPEQLLLLAVLTRAIQDATGNVPNERREALHWLRADDCAEWSLIWLLREIDWPPCSRRRIWRFVNSGEALDVSALRARAYTRYA